MCFGHGEDDRGIGEVQERGRGFSIAWKQSEIGCTKIYVSSSLTGDGWGVIMLQGARLVLMIKNLANVQGRLRMLSMKKGTSKNCQVTLYIVLEQEQNLSRSCLSWIESGQRFMTRSERYRSGELSEQLWARA